MTPIDERTIALAGILQVTEQVQSLARNGAADADAENTARRSILILDAASTPAVFGGVSGVANGLRLLADGLLTSPQGEHLEMLGYAMALINLQEKLQRDTSRFSEFGTEIERLSALDADALPAACSEIYQKYISGLQPQVIVQGEQDFLQQEDIPPRIRALLLAGIRSAVLWHQKGGGRFRLLWERTRMLHAARRMLDANTH